MPHGKHSASPKASKRFKPLSKKVHVSSNGSILSFVLIEPSSTDYGFAIALFSFLSLALYLTGLANLTVQILALLSSLYLCTTFIDDTHSITIDKLKGTIKSTKSKFGKTSRVRVGQIREAVALHIVEDKISLKRNGFALEFELLNDQGFYYRLRCADTLVVGDVKVTELESVKADVEGFLGIEAKNPFASEEFAKNLVERLGAGCFHEVVPYTRDVRSIYHIRAYNEFRLSQITEPLDIFISHDWSCGIYHCGNTDLPLRQKGFFELVALAEAEVLQQLRQPVKVKNPDAIEITDSDDEADGEDKEV
ncbi:UNVERIFIED_CONTAM: lariat debranching enzyme [Siphonaria sp. JEL0065]|nr:lariat debranching enzyme [Siphonaria sp. JEL0065]